MKDKLKIGDLVFVLPYQIEQPSGRQIHGNRWGKIIDKQKGKQFFFVEGKNKLGGWEKIKNLELINL